MTVPGLPLAAASIRLRGKPGRPRLGTTRAQSDAQTRMNGGSANSSQDSESGRPAPLTERRLLDVAGLAAYLSLADDTIRDLDARGVLASARVRVPGPDGQPLRRVLFDRSGIDRLVSGWGQPEHGR